MTSDPGSAATIPAAGFVPEHVPPRHPLEHGIPPAWAAGWGQDRYGVFVDADLAGWTQRMRWIPAGRFMMGSPSEEEGRLENEDRHMVTLTRGFWLADSPCTVGLYERITGKDEGSGEEQEPPDVARTVPAMGVSFDDARAFLRRLPPADDDHGWRLPTEAEWEYACRAGTRTAHYGEPDGYELEDIAWFARNSKGDVYPVKHLRPNAWGLYDMLGNVLEWCSDWYEGSLGSGAVVDPRGPQDGAERVLRGGSWSNPAVYVRAAFRLAVRPGFRGFFDGYVGFRLARGQG